MSWFAEPNRDAMTVAPETVATGPRAGFLRSFETAYQQQVRGAAMFGIQEAMRNREDRQRQALRDAGVENIPSISQQADDPLRMFTDFGTDYLDAAKFYEKGGDPKIKDRLSEYDYRVFELKKKYPQLDLETSGEMWESVKKEAQKYEQRASTDRPDFGGVVGGFLGGAVGGLNPNTDPLNFATLPVGGAGKTMLGRIAGQAISQGAIESVNQVGGVQDQRRMLGLGYGPGDAIMRIGGAAVGGAVVQGAGEAIGAGFRKFFQGDPKVPDAKVPERKALPAPAREGEMPTTPATVASTFVERPQAYYDFINEVNPMRTTRAGKARMIDDLTHVEAHLDAWDGPAPWEIPPKTDTAPVRSLSDFTKQPSVEDIAFKADIDEFARVIDPETFAKYDKLVDEPSDIVRSGEFDLRHVYSNEGDLPTQFSADYSGPRYDGDTGGVYGDGLYLAADQKWLDGSVEFGYGKRQVGVKFRPKNALKITPESLPRYSAAIEKFAGKNYNARAIADWAKSKGHDAVIIEGWDKLVEDIYTKYDPMVSGTSGARDVIPWDELSTADKKMVLANVNARADKLTYSDSGPWTSREHYVAGFTTEGVSSYGLKEAKLRALGMFDDNGAQDQVVVFDTNTTQIGSEVDPAAPMSRVEMKVSGGGNEAKRAELEPLIDRAYARARAAWTNSNLEREAIKTMIREGNRTVQPATDSEAFVAAAIARQDITETIPVLQQRPEGMKPDSDAADVQMRVYEERNKATEDAAAVFQADAKRLLVQAEKLDEMTPEQKRAATMEREPGELPPDQFMVPGYKEPMSLNERIEVADDDGNISSITVRELLQRQADADEDLRAVSSCSLR